MFYLLVGILKIISISVQQPHKIGSCDQGAESNDQKFRSYGIWISNNHKWERVFGGEIKDE